ncbi:MAG: tetratricopeptide repeat protein, partial [Deltaproteobacteria bacterium]|nr:tetratricopeptide repeat protein [Deltaproteobacteria bacterium]
LVDLYLRRADRSLEAKEKIAILGKVCNLYEEVLEDPEQAIGVYRQILDVDPEHPGAVRGLDRLLNLLERWEELAELLMRQAELTADGEEQIQVRHRLAVLLHEHLQRTGDSIDTFRNILLDVPGHAGAIRSMEQMLASIGGQDTDAVAFRQQLCDLLEPFYEEREDWPRLIGLLDIRFGDAEDTPSRVHLLRQIADVQERRMREPGRAFATQCQAMIQDFGNEELGEELDRLAEELNAWDKLINVYIDGLEGVEEHEIAVVMLLKLAQIFDDRLHHVPNAVECYRRLLTLEEGHPQALDALERLYAGAGAHEQLVGVLTEKAKRAQDPVEKKELWYRICEIWDEVLTDRHQAIAAYRTLLELDPEDLVAIEALERLYRATGDWQNLVEIYRQKVTLASDLEEQIGCLFEIAQLEEEALQDPDAAIDACRHVLDLDPVNPRAFGTLQNLFKREKRWTDLLQLLEQALSIASSPAAMDAIQMQIGELQVNELKVVEDAIDTYRTILDRTERHEG